MARCHSVVRHINQQRPKLVRVSGAVDFVDQTDQSVQNHINASCRHVFSFELCPLTTTIGCRTLETPPRTKDEHPLDGPAIPGPLHEKRRPRISLRTSSCRISPSSN